MPHRNEPSGALSFARTDLPTLQPKALSELLDAALIEALALDKQPTGYTASIFLGLDGAVGKWTDRVFASTASEAIEKALRGLPVPAPVILTPPPY